MKRSIVICGLSALMAVSIPSWANATEPMAEISAVNNDIDINVNGSTLIVSNAQGMTLQVVSLTGKVVASIRVDSQSQRIELPIAKGCYLIKVGNIARKVAIK